MLCYVMILYFHLVYDNDIYITCLFSISQSVPDINHHIDTYILVFHLRINATILS